MFYDVCTEEQKQMLFSIRTIAVDTGYYTQTIFTRLASLAVHVLVSRGVLFVVFMIMFIATNVSSCRMPNAVK